MEISKTSLLFFSPTGGTKCVSEHIAKEIAMDGKYDSFDVTIDMHALVGRIFSSNELLIVAFPVYGGRVPKPMVERMKTLKADGTPVVLVAVYGNRAYDDALLEAKNTLSICGFKTIAAGAFVAEHSVISDFGKGRPDQSDMAVEKFFSKAILEKLRKTENASALKEISVPGNRAYVKYNGIPLKPHASSKCVRCGTCAKNCPMGVIPVSDPKKTNKTECISCMRCINVCPYGARKLNPLMLILAKDVMKKYCSGRKEPETFI